MSIRVCENNHITGYRRCPQCLSETSEPLANRQKPVYVSRRDMRELRDLRARTRAGGKSHGPKGFYAVAH